MHPRYTQTRRRPGRVLCALGLGMAVGLLLGACGTDEVGAGLCRDNATQLVADGRLTVGVDMDFPPLALHNPETGTPTGFEIELLREAATRLDLELRIRDRASAGLVPALLAQRFDVAAGLKASQTAEQACLTSPHLRGDLGLLVGAAHADQISGTGDLDGLRVGAVRDTAGAAWIREELGGDASRTRSFPIEDDAVATLIAGQVDAVVIDLPQAAYRQRIHPEVVLVDTIGRPDNFVFAVHHDHEGLRDELDRALDELRADGTYDRLVDEWFADDRVVP